MDFWSVAPVSEPTLWRSDGDDANMQMLADFKHVATGIGGDLPALPLRIGLISALCLAA
jgi:hypothetical protein